MNSDQLEKQTQDILLRNDWQVSGSVYYTDPNTQKPREKDNLATAKQFSEDDPRAYTVRLFIECKLFPEETHIIQKMGLNEIQHTLFTHNIPYANTQEIEEHRKTHIYEYNAIFNLKDSSNFLYSAIAQNLQSFAAFRKVTSENALYYLIVVFDGPLCATDENALATPCNNALVQIKSIDHAFFLPRGECFIEIVSISQFENLLKKIKMDIQEINNSSRFYQRMAQNKLEEKRRQVMALRNRFR